ncbi:hypothetical protein SCLCIDRAFT_136438, partial [Scleroderma citrinum Foug A]
QMNYLNYEHSIVEKHGVALVGWPEELLPVQNPVYIGSREVVKPLWEALVSKTCHWIRLTNEQHQERIKDNQVHQARGEEVYKPRKKCPAAVTQGQEENVD